jgi:hypothetical protein
VPGLSVDQFGRNAVASGLFTAAELKAIWSSIPVADRPKDGEAFSALLVKRARLNEFQAKELLSGARTPLVLNQYVLLGKSVRRAWGKSSTPSIARIIRTS